MGVCKRVLLAVDHAPDYREAFFRLLGEQCELTVVAQPCQIDNLVPPPERCGYSYLELPVRRAFGFTWQIGLHRLLDDRRWDVLCIDLNLRQLARVAFYFRHPARRNRWIWRGHIFGRSDSCVVRKVRMHLLRSAAGCLVYSEGVRERLLKSYGIPSTSFNNTEVSLDQFRRGAHRVAGDRLRLLFVGRHQARKRLDRLVSLAQRREDICVRLVGPGMHALEVPTDLLKSGRVALYDRTIGNALNEHFDWADLVANPGHVGLLVMSAARHGKAIVIDSGSDHAPEYWLAKQAAQPMIDFSDATAIDAFLDKVLANRGCLKTWSEDLQSIAKKEYTVEHMAHVHARVFAQLN